MKLAADTFHQTLGMRKKDRSRISRKDSSYRFPDRGSSYSSEVKITPELSYQLQGTSKPEIRTKLKSELRKQQSKLQKLFSVSETCKEKS